MRFAHHRIGVVAGCLLAAAASAWASPIETPVDTAGATGFVPLVYGAHTLNAALSTIVETDTYTFAALAGDKVRLVVSSISNGFDPVIQVRDPGGIVVGSATCSGHDPFGNPILCATKLDSALANAGIYTVSVSDSGTNNIGAYTLHVDQYPPVSNWLGLAFGVTLPHAIDHRGDSDYFGFNVNSGSQFRVSVGSLSAGLDVHIEAWDPTGTLVTNASCAGHDPFGNPILCSALIDVMATASGIYKVGVDDTGFNNLGNYQIGLSCLFGVCQPVPELPTGALFGLGLAAIGWRRFGKLSS